MVELSSTHCGERQQKEVPSVQQYTCQTFSAPKFCAPKRSCHHRPAQTAVQPKTVYQRCPQYRRHRRYRLPTERFTFPAPCRARSTISVPRLSPTMTHIVIPPSQLPPRSLRTLRRSISFPLHILSVDQWHPQATHVVLQTPLPSVTLVCAIAAAPRINLVSASFLYALSDSANPDIQSLTETHRFPLKDLVLHADTNLLWAGRIWLGAYEIWKSTPPSKLPLSETKVAIVGQLRPRGAAASAAPSTAVLCHVLSAAGASVVPAEQQPLQLSFAIVAPGLNASNSSVVQTLVQNHVLCLGPAFAIDLILRVDANPQHYILFKQQQHLCSKKFTITNIPSNRGSLQVAHPNKTHSGSQLSNTHPDQQRHLQQSPEDDQSRIPSGTAPTACGASERVTLRLRTRAQNSKPPTKHPKKSTSKQRAKRPRSQSVSTPPLDPERTQQAKTTQQQITEQAINNKVEPPPPQSAAPSGSKTNSSSMPVQNVRKSARLRAKRDNSSQSVIVASSSHSDARRNSAASVQPTSAVASNALPSLPSKPRRKSARASRKQEQKPQPKREPSHSTKSKALSSAKKQKVHEGQQAKTDIVRPQPSIAASPHDSGNRHTTPELSEAVNKAVAAVVEDDAEETVRSKPHTKQDRIKPFGPVASPVTPAENDRTRKRSLNLSADARSSSSEEEDIRITRPQKRPRRNESASETAPKSQLHSGEQKAIGKHDPVQSLDFDKLSSSDSAKEQHDDSTMKLFDDAQTKHLSPLSAAINAESEHHSNLYGDPSVSRRSKDSFRRRRRSWDVDSDDDDNTLLPVGEDSALDLRDDNNASIDSIEEGFHFFLQRMGGEPSENDIRGFVKALGGEVDSDSDQDPGADKNARGIREDSDCEERSPVLLDDDAAHFGEGGAYVSYHAEDLKEAEGRDLLTQYLQNHGTRVGSQRIHGEKETDAFYIPAPSSPILLRHVIPPELAVPERASKIPKATGNSADDQLCETTLDATEWILGAENFIGWNGVEGMNDRRKLSNTNFRQIWSALFESKALGKLAIAGGQSESETRTITGIFVRLLACDPDVDVISVLAKELIDLRKVQTDSGFDSLAVFLASKDGGSVPFRHRAIAGIWTAAIRRAAQGGGHDEAWRLINKALELWFAELFDEKKIINSKDFTDEKKMVDLFLSGLILISIMFAVRLDIEEGVLSTAEGGDSPLCPENWIVVCNGIDRLVKSIAGSNDVDRSEKVLMSFIKSFSVHLSGRLWPVSEKVLMATSKAVLSASKARNQNCFCAKTATVASRFASLTLVSDRSRLESELKTGCDCLLYLGWQYAREEGGNVMKRAMSVIKNGAPFTRRRVDANGSSSCAVNHHVGVLLTVADGLSSSSKNGEYLFCRMLTSKCPPLQKVAEHVARNGGDKDLGWSAIMEAICIRCKVVLAQGKDLSVYMEWLSENVVGNLMVMRKCTERKGAESGTREVLRVQDSIFSSLAVRTFGTLSKVARDLTRKVREDGAGAVKIAARALGKCWNHVGTLARFGLEVLGQIEAHGAEWIAKKRHLVLGGLMEVIEEEMRLSIEVRKAQKQHGDEGVRSKLMGGEGAVEALAMGAMRVKSVDDEKWGRKIKQRGGAVMGMVICIDWMENEGKGEDKRLQEAMDRVRRYKMTETAADANGEFDERVMIGFWGRSVWEEWGKLAAERVMEVRRVCVSCVVWGYVSEGAEWEEEEREMLKGLCRRLGQVGGLQGVMAALKDVQLGGAGREVDEEGRNGKVRGLEKAMMALRKLGGAVIGDVVEVVEGVGRRCEKKVTKKRREKTELQEGVTTLALCLGEKAELRGGVGGGGRGGWAVGWLEAVCEGVGRLRNCGGGLSSTEAMQRHVMRALSTTERDSAVEAAVLLVRLVDATDERDALRGVWGGGGGGGRRRPDARGDETATSGARWRCTRAWRRCCSGARRWRRVWRCNGCTRPCNCRCRTRLRRSGACARARADWRPRCVGRYFSVAALVSRVLRCVVFFFVVAFGRAAHVRVRSARRLALLNCTLSVAPPRPRRRVFIEERPA